MTVRLSRFVWERSDDASRRRALSRPALDSAEDVARAVADICDQVRRRGDAAVVDFTERFDGVRIDGLRIDDDVVRSAVDAIGVGDRECLERARDNVEAFHRLQRPRSFEIETEPGVLCKRVSRPLERVGLYVPGGSAPLVSTLLMLAVPARLAGCNERIVCTPPGPDGRVADHILAAAALSGVTAVYRIGGAQAIAAMAYGTGTIAPVDKIFGPGNAYVAAAKALVASVPGGVAVDAPAGPSEVLVVADESADPAFVAADLLSQAEHDENAQVVLVTTSPALLDRVDVELTRQLEELPRRAIAEVSLRGARAIVANDLAEAIEISNAYAPEHLILACDDADALAESVRHAGSVFLGPWSAEAFGDYASGTNHVLPTYGHARAFSGLTLESFSKTMTIQRIASEAVSSLGPVVERLARLEGLEGHARAVARRRTFLESR